jgi:hypothetical protein
MSNKTFDRLALFARVILPAIITCYGTIGEALDIPYTAVVLVIAAAINTALGTILKGLSNRYYADLESEGEENDE